MAKKCGIYKYTNMINRKVYIGLSTNIAKRKNYHHEAITDENDVRYNYHFYTSMRKYGYENFKFEILEECPKEKLREREMYYIALYESNNPSKGYNKTSGGEFGEHYTRCVYQIDLHTGKIVHEFNSIKEADESVGANCHVGSACRNKHYQCKGYLWRYKDEYDPKEVAEEIERRKHRVTSYEGILRLLKLFMLLILILPLNVVFQDDLLDGNGLSYDVALIYTIIMNMLKIVPIQ